MELSYQTLKKTHENVKGTYPEALNLRIHRALSWLRAAEKNFLTEIGQPRDSDFAFIAFWISFNAIYSNEKLEGGPLTRNEKGELRDFLSSAVTVDKEKILYNFLWNEFGSSIRLLVDHKYLSAHFWKYQAGEIEEKTWIERDNREKEIIFNAMKYQNTERVLFYVIQYLRLLRNQVFHGSSTYESRVNRTQIKIGIVFLKKFVPLLIYLVLNNPRVDWGDVRYPVIEQKYY